jgi:hypothetical protein
VGSRCRNPWRRESFWPGRGIAGSGSNTLAVPENITLVPLPPCSPECTPVERIRLFLHERFPSLAGIMRLSEFPGPALFIGMLSERYQA